MSFFDEDDEPTRTTSRTRTQARVRPRSARPSGSGGAPDAQALLVRRIVAVVAGAFLLFALFFIVKSCNSNRHEAALKDYNRQVANIATASQQTGDSLFKALSEAGSGSPNDLYQRIIAMKSSADGSLKQAQELKVPGDMTDAQQSLLIALELRRDGLEAIAAKIQPALGDEGQVANDAIEAIAGQNRSFDASDVLYQARVQRFIDDALKSSGIGGQTRANSQFMRDISWVSPTFVASKLGKTLSTDGGDGEGNTASDEPTGPGLHGSGLNGTSYGNVNLQPGTPNRMVYTADQPFTVSFTNQGENEEFNVDVTLKIARTSGGGGTITLKETVPKISPQEKVTVSLPLTKEPAADTALTITVTVAKVPGEEKTDNNKATYPAIFSQG
ncbi:hypothetical protein OJ997_28290 [Solirubrobacter phytolaccae]|uniref:CARDB domain-containing protein n=1 Tax=Solirubrobacter phytolaccae TaxID=1404360 RepID=A0A9X3NMN1_9ACTN|nr:hypothetical protein [Solirubrobacter phytolaccae]MDA0184242.1 hypothetical protein [Solirubrobacter phytolaccae]